MARTCRLPAAIFALLFLRGSILMAGAAVGINWGTLSSHKLAPSVVVDLLKENRIEKVKLFEADHSVLRALMGSGIEVMVGIPNEMLGMMASSAAVADSWVNQNVTRYTVKGGVDIRSVTTIPYVRKLISGLLFQLSIPADFSSEFHCFYSNRYIAVGNEPFLSSYQGQFQSFVLPALINVQQSLSKANLAGYIKLLVPCNADAYQSTSVPSLGSFRPELTQTMTQIASFLSSNGSPFVVNIYPFLSLVDSSDFPQEYAFFEGTSHQVVDGQNVYYNAFDGNYDTLVAALNRIGYGQMPIVIGEVGWPTDGTPSANLTAARAFNQGLINHVLSLKGTPLRPGSPPVDVYLFSLLDEDQKALIPGNFERHWGIFSFDGQSKYPLNLGLGNGRLKNAKDVNYLPSRWCVANPSTDLSGVSSHLKLACSVADCTTLAYGGSCNMIGERGNISYAFNSYYQAQKQNEQSCDFDGLGMVTFLDPSIGDCRFVVGINDISYSCLVCGTFCRIWFMTFWVYLVFRILGSI